MKLAISNIAWNISENSNIYNYLNSKGIKFIEIAPTKIVGENPYNNIEKLIKETKSLKDNYDLKIVSMQSIWYGKTENIFASKENAENLIEYTKKAIDFASAIKCENLVFGCPKNRNMFDKEKDYVKAVDFFKKIGEYAGSKGVVIALEPNPTIYNTNFLNYTSEAIEFVKNLNMPSVKINYDLGTVIYNEESLDTLKENISLVNHIHISEPNLNIIEKRNIHKELLKILKNNNYEKFVSIEMKEQSVEDVKKVIDYIVNINNEVSNEI